MSSAIGKLAEKIKQNKKLEIAIYIGIAALAVLLYLSGNSCSVGVTDSGSGAIRTKEAALEKRLEEILAKMEGVGDIEVMLTCSEKSDMSDEEVSMFQVKQDVGNLGEFSVNGVIVVAEGASNIATRVKIQYAVSTVLGIDPYSVEVFERRESE